MCVSAVWGKSGSHLTGEFHCFETTPTVGDLLQCKNETVKKILWPYLKLLRTTYKWALIHNLYSQVKKAAGIFQRSTHVTFFYILSYVVIEILNIPSKFLLSKSESHELKISCNDGGMAHSDIFLMNQTLLSGAISLCNIYTLPVQDMPPKHWPQSDCLLQPLLQRIIQQWISNGGGGRGGGVCFPTEVKAKVRIRFGFARR